MGGSPRGGRSKLGFLRRETETRRRLKAVEGPINAHSHLKWSVAALIVDGLKRIRATHPQRAEAVGSFPGETGRCAVLS